VGHQAQVPREGSDSIIAAFDLFDCGDVAENADAIVGSLRSGQMPCDGAWPESQVDKIQRWLDAGKPRLTNQQPWRLTSGSR